MQSSYRLIAAGLLFWALLPGCYRHVGSPFGGDDQGWHRAAMEACERGDEPAYRALSERSREASDCPLFNTIDTDED